VPVAPGKSLEERLLAGELAAAINIPSQDPAVQPFIADPLEAGIAAFRARGHYPINHCIVVRNAVLDAHPKLAGALFEAFAEAKRRYLADLAARPTDGLDGSDQIYRRLLDLGSDPLPYGIEPNERVLDELIAHALTQGILTRRPELAELFARDTLTMCA
jgi:4,5-dihydroxyphthalate decarboxylase